MCSKSSSQEQQYQNDNNEESFITIQIQNNPNPTQLILWPQERCKDLHIESDLRVLTWAMKTMSLLSMNLFNSTILRSSLSDTTIGPVYNFNDND